MNRVVIMGRLTRDPDVRYTSDQKAVSRFSLAVGRRYKRDGEQLTDFIPCVAFGKTAEIMEKYVHKGTKLLVEGRWQTGSYKNKDGQMVYTNDCMVESFEFAESKKSAGTSEPVAVPEGFEEIEADDLPF